MLSGPYPGSASPGATSDAWLGRNHRSRLQIAGPFGIAGAQTLGLGHIKRNRTGVYLMTNVKATRTAISPTASTAIRRRSEYT